MRGGSGLVGRYRRKGKLECLVLLMLVVFSAQGEKTQLKVKESSYIRQGKVRGYEKASKLR